MLKQLERESHSNEDIGRSQLEDSFRPFIHPAELQMNSPHAEIAFDILLPFKAKLLTRGLSGS